MAPCNASAIVSAGAARGLRHAGRPGSDTRSAVFLSLTPAAAITSSIEIGPSAANG
jgi:hypothetical protein